MNDDLGPEFIRHLTDSQPWLRAFVRALLPVAGDVDEVVQRVNVVLWQKADRFEPGTNFRAWAAQVARFEALAYCRERKNDRHAFSVELVQSLAENAERQLAASEEMRVALRKCLDELRTSHREVIKDRYSEDGSVNDIADRTGRTPDAVSAMIYRIKKILLKCIRGRITAEQGGAHV
jgi:RNA polymerase sigma-70 factor, ECF subfamily